MGVLIAYDSRQHSNHLCKRTLALLTYEFLEICNIVLDYPLCRGV